MNNKCVCTLAAGLFLSAATIAGAQSTATIPTGTPPSPTQQVQYELQRLTALLGLTSEQQTQVRTILAAERTATASLGKNLRAAQESLKSAIQKDDADAISTLATQIGALMGQGTEASAKAQASIYAILTSEQQTRYAQLLSEGPGHGGPGGPPPMGGR